MSNDPKTTNEKSLRDTLKSDPSDWETRKQLAHTLYDRGAFADASNVIWDAEEIPGIDLELAFAARVLAKATPRKAIRLLSALIELNQGKPAQNLGLANALLHHGMVLQAARFYGAAMEADSSLGNPDLEHFILWTDDEETLWSGFNSRRPKLGELPWMTRDPKEAMHLTGAVSQHTSPVKVPNLKPSSNEELNNELYEQTAEKGAQPSPPPAVTIPVDRVAPKDRMFDPDLGAPSHPESPDDVGNPKPSSGKSAKTLATPQPPTEPPISKDLPQLTEPTVPSTPAVPKPSIPAPDGAPTLAKPSLPGGKPAPKKLNTDAPKPKPKLPPLVKTNDKS